MGSSIVVEMCIPEDINVGWEGFVDPAFHIQVVRRGLPRHIPCVHRYSAHISVENSTMLQIAKVYARIQLEIYPCSPILVMIDELLAQCFGLSSHQ